MQFCIVFAVIASLAAADLAPSGEVAFAGPKLIATMLVQLIVVLLAWAISKQTHADVQSMTMARDAVMKRLERRYSLHLAVWITTSICILGCFDWPRMVQSWSWANDQFWRPLVLLSPILLPLIASWAFLFDAEKSVATLTDAAVGKVNSELPRTRWQHVLSQLRGFVLVPLIPILVIAAWLQFCDQHLPTNIVGIGAFASWLVRGIPLILVASLFPLLLRHVWRTQPMQPGTLRASLETRCQQLGFDVSEILIWQTDGRMLNAAVAGFTSRLRYVFLTDRLVRDLKPSQVECIFLHEVAHARLRHSRNLLLAFCGTLGATFVAVGLVLKEATASWSESASATVMLAGMLVGFVASYLLVGRYARLLELQADLWAARRSPDPDEYLRAIASIATGDPDTATWMHPSFQQRCEFLMNGFQSAADSVRFRLRMAVTQLLAFVAGLVAFSLLAYVA